MNSMIGRFLSSGPMQQSAQPPAQEFPGGAQPPPGTPGSAGQLPGQLGGNMQNALGADASHLSGALHTQLQLQQQQQATEGGARVEEHVNSGPGEVRTVRGGERGGGAEEDVILLPPPPSTSDRRGERAGGMNGPETDLDAAIAASSVMVDMLDAEQAHAAGPAPGLGAGMQHVQPIQQSTADNQEPARKRQKRNDGEAAAASLLEQLRYGQVIKKIAEIRKLTTEDKITKFGHQMVLPRIIVIGNESSGKSSTLERIAGQPVLPCDTGICTRAPVVLEYRFSSLV